MNKCFITKLPSSVDNDNLPVLGQLRINWLKQDGSTAGNQRCIRLSTNDEITVKVFGAHFTDNTLTSNLGNTKTITSANGSVSLYVSNDSDAVLTIDNRYSLTSVAFILQPWDSTSKPIYLNLEDIKYCTNLTTLAISTIQLSGDISALSNLTNLKELYLGYTTISGDISALSNLTNLGYLNINNTNITGDISAVSKLTNIETLNLVSTQISGKIDSLANLTKLTSLNGLRGLSLTGDMSKIPAGVSFISQNNRKVTTNFTWTANGRQNATLLAMEGNIPFDTASMDNMLIDQATCTFKPTSIQYARIISVSGTRTSASDAAVATIQNMGVTIAGVAKQA